MSVARYYEEYWSPGGHRPLGSAFPQLIDVLDRFARPGSDWLDVGCGDGQTAGFALKGHGATYVGVDVSQAAVEAARAAGLEARVVEDATALGFTDASFDGVVCVEVLEHVFEPQRVAAEIRRVLRPGGVFFATVPNVSYWRRRLELAAAGRFDPIGDRLSVEQPWRDPHLRFFTPATLERMLLSVDFEVPSVDGQEGAFLRDLPWLGRRIRNPRVSPVYRYAQKRAPSLFAQRLRVVAFKPMHDNAGP